MNALADTIGKLLHLAPCNCSETLNRRGAVRHLEQLCRQSVTVGFIDLDVVSLAQHHQNSEDLRCRSSQLLTDFGLSKTVFG